MATTRRRYTREFKIEAVRLLETSGKSASQIERELGIGKGNLWRWKRKFGSDSEQATSGPDGRTPEQDRCVEKTPITGFPKHIKVAHLHADPDEGVVWFNDACGTCLGSLDPATGGEVTVYEINDKHDQHLDGMEGMGGFPWNLEVDDGAVYSGEYATRHILRLDKATRTYTEARIPFDNPDVRLHSLAIDRMRQRLWFTLTNETPSPINPAASTIGFIDLSSWRSHVEDPERNPTIHGVIYRGLDRIPAEKGAPTHQAFRGIAVDRASGRLALATMWREQITVLTPLPGFWP